MSESASIVLVKSSGLRAELRLSRMPDGHSLADSDTRLVAELVSILSGLLYPGADGMDLAEVRRQIEWRAERSASPIRVEFEARWKKGECER